jgi:hypothetical protein
MVKTFSMPVEPSGYQASTGLIFIFDQTHDKGQLPI